jgi:hypothetical protein
MKNYKSTTLSILSLLLAIYAVATCSQIEALNQKIGGYLPRTDFTEEGNNKWRTSMITTEEAWKKFVRPKINGAVDESPLSPAEQVQMQKDVQISKDRNKLGSLVSGRGALQYPICFSILFFSILIWRFSKQTVHRICALTAICLAIACLAYAFHRGYWTSQPM